MSEMHLEILNSQKSLNLDLKRIRNLAEFVIQNELDLYVLKHKIKIFWNRAEFYIHWMNEKTMVQLHRKTHNDSSPTDVVSIDYWEECLRLSQCSQTEEFVLGEVFVNVDEAKKVWKAEKTSVSFELLLYLVHGILHLFGYEDIQESDRLKMKERESFYMNVFSHRISILKKTRK